MWRVILVLVVLSGCQTAENIKPIDSSPYHVKFSYNEWYGGNQWPGMEAYAESYCSSIGKSLDSLQVGDLSVIIKFTDNSLNKHVTYPCFTPAEKAWVKKVCDEGGGMCFRVVEVFLAARGVDTSLQIQKLLRQGGALLTLLPPASSTVSRTTNAPIGYSSCSYKVGNTVWTDTVKGVCPPSSSKGGLLGVLVR